MKIISVVWKQVLHAVRVQNIVPMDLHAIQKFHPVMRAAMNTAVIAVRILRVIIVYPMHVWIVILMVHHAMIIENV